MAVTAQTTEANRAATIAALRRQAAATAGVRAYAMPALDDYVATAAVSSPRVVVTADDFGGVRQADTSIAADAARVVGISVTEAMEGGALSVRSAGLLEDNSLALDVTRRVFCDTDGRLTQTPAAAGWIMCVGHPVTPTSLLVNLDPPIYRP